MEHKFLNKIIIAPQINIHGDNIMKTKTKSSKSYCGKFRNMMYEQQLKYMPFKNTGELKDIIETKVEPERYAFIIHDKDEDVEPHIHVMLQFENLRHITAIAKLLGDKEQYIQKWDNRSENGFAYLVHRTKGSMAKHQYSLSEVTANFNIADMINENTKKMEKKSGYAIDTKLDLLKCGFITKKQLISELSGSQYARYKRKIDDVDHLRLELAAEKWRAEKKAEGATVKVIWIFGITETGKSSLAKELAEKMNQPYYFSGSSRDLFQDYNGEHTIILDELRPESIPYQDFLRMTDPHGMTETHTAAPSRYFDKVLAADTIIITSPLEPMAFYQQMFVNPSQRRFDPFDQFERRIAMAIMCTEDLICEIDLHSTNNRNYIINSMANPYSKKQRTQQPNDKSKLRDLLFNVNNKGGDDNEKSENGK